MSSDYINDDGLGVHARTYWRASTVKAGQSCFRTISLLIKRLPFLIMSIVQEVTGLDSLFNDSLSGSHSLLHKIE